MTVAAPLDLGVRLQDLFQYIREGRIIEALKEFYAPDCSMQENNQATTGGLVANIEREQQFLRGSRNGRDSGSHPSPSVRT